MPKTVVLVDFSELLRYAGSIGIDWNTAHEYLVNDGIPPMYESNSCEYTFSEFVYNPDGHKWAPTYSDETYRIMVGFMVKENLDGFTLVND
jgi:hypothetical protein